MASAKDRRVRCLIHIPGQYPDGREVEPEKMEGFLQILDRQFGGSTPLGIVPGRWLDEGKTTEEPMHRIEVAVKKSELANFEKVARQIGRETEQKAIYIVINYESEVQILFTEEEEPDKGEDPPSGLATNG